MPKVLVASPDQRQWLSLLDELLSRDIATECTDSLAATLDGLSRLNPACLIVDCALLDDLAFHLREFRGRFPGISVLVISRRGSIRQAVKAIKSGADDYFSSPVDAAEIEAAIRGLVPDVAEYSEDGVVAADPLSRELLALTRKVARSDATVLITGESGTGKEVIARLLHKASQRADKPFVAINCAAIPDNMLEAILFGYERGAFTGANESRPGKFEAAQHGTLLLDEISEMELGLQAKILRVLQEREVERIGGKRLIALDVRVLATSNRDLHAETARGRFREDLFYRLAVFPLRVPALRERPFDIMPLTLHFIRSLCKGERPPRMSESAERKISGYAWPGNVRELENVLQRAMILHCGEFIKAADIHLDGKSSVATSHSPADPDPDADLDTAMRYNEGQLIIEALTAENGRRKEAAERLGISARTLRYKLAKLRDAGVAIP